MSVTIYAGFPAWMQEKWRSVILSSKLSRCQVPEETIYFSVCPHCFSPVLVAAWILLSCCGALPLDLTLLFVALRIIQKMIQWYKRQFEIHFEHPEWGTPENLIAFQTTFKYCLHPIWKNFHFICFFVFLLSRLSKINLVTIWTCQKYWFGLAVCQHSGTVVFWAKS